MRGLGFVALAALVLVVSSSKQDSSRVRPAHEDEITSLPGLKDKINFKQYSGFLNGGPTSGKLLHYWFVESQNDPVNDPVLLWVNGGPGCSSLLGLFKELGPFALDPKDPRTLVLRETSWNKLANVLFLDSPLGVGFSDPGSDFDIQNDDTAALLNHLAIHSFFQKFPQFKNNSLYLSGESHAGAYLSILGLRIDADPELNLKGIAIGNGYLHVSLLYKSLNFFAYYHGAVGQSIWKRVSKLCCKGRPPSPESCDFSHRSSKCEHVRLDIMKAIQYSGLNAYNIYADCADSGNHFDRSREHLNRQAVDMALMRFALNQTSHNEESSLGYIFNAKQEIQEAIDFGYSPCTDDSALSEYLNSPDVLKAIHISDKHNKWSACYSLNYEIKYPRHKYGLKPQLNKLIDSHKNLTLLIYNGDVDSVCNFLGNEWFVDQLGRQVVKDYAQWKVGKQIGGWAKHYEGITFATVRGAGHMVPQDRPEAAFELIKSFLNAKGKVIEL